MTEFADQIVRTKGFSGRFTLVHKERDNLVGSDEISHVFQKNRVFDIKSKIHFGDDMERPVGRTKQLETAFGVLTEQDFNKDFKIFGLQNNAFLDDDMVYYFHESHHLGQASVSLSVQETVGFQFSRAEVFDSLSVFGVKESVVHSFQTAFTRDREDGLDILPTVTYDYLSQQIFHPGILVPRIYHNIHNHTVTLGVGEAVSYQVAGRDSMVYDVKNDVWAEYTNMKIINANVLNSGIALDNVNLLLKNSGEIRKYPSNQITKEQGIVTTKMIQVEKGAIQSVGIIGQDDTEIIMPPHVGGAPVKILPKTVHYGEINVKIGVLNEEDSQIKQARLQTPIKMRGKINPIPNSNGYGRTFFAQIKNMLSIRSLIFKFKDRTENKK